MPLSLLTVNIGNEHDTVNARQRARQVARLLGFDSQDQTRVSTAVSEIARNVFNYAGHGKVEYLVEGHPPAQSFLVRVSDKGPGIQDLDAVRSGRYESKTGMGLGIVGARRLMDEFGIESAPGRGTVVLLKKRFPPRVAAVTQGDLARIAEQLLHERTEDPIRELQFQNQELLRALEEVRARQIEMTQLNKELEDTNRGVVALYAELDEQAERLRKADELKSKFLSNMSHEFRSPLNSILALSALLRNRSDGDLTPGQEQQVGFIRRAAQDLLELVNDLLDLAKVEAGKAEAKPARFEAANLFAALRGMLKPLLVNPSVELVFEDASPIPPLFSDEGKVSQILRNFISNALKFTEKGEVRVSAALAGDEVVFSVADTGIGIAPGDQEAVFQDFVQLNHRLQGSSKGTGLGLPLSRKLAELLGGSVHVSSAQGVGSTFRVRIPRVFRKEDYRENAPEATDGEAGKKILIIDDNDVDRYLLRQHMRNLPVMPMEEPGGKQGLRRAAESRPDMIFLDLAMPDMTGFEVLKLLRNRRETEDIPVVVVTSRSLTEAESRELLQECSGILRKGSLNEKIVRDCIYGNLKVAEVNI